ncbi:hypothetical protein [Corynebacterium bovis]|uniref:hypothetical protein n=1 Tax=Corynebacterium bovis TaxID=36808 RepID=UPI000F65186F|nr:hypothetical protein [Corynebacterium bovis]RRQ16660.1 hypothetical protein CXF46_00850 [Corynebacterium bovis]
MTAQSPIADLNDTLLAWASSTEARLAGLLREVEVFVDLDISGDDVERLTTFYGTFLSRQIAAGGSEEALIEACPALTATTLIARAARLNQVGELGREYWAGLGLEPDARRTGLLDYRAILVAAGLDPMDAVADGPDGEIGRLFAHVGIASDWQPELIELIDSRRGTDDELPDPADEARAVVAALSGGDRQAGPLATVLPDLAVRLITPLVEIVRFAAAHPVTWRATLPDTGLPRLIVEDVVEELRERPVGTVERRHTVGVANREENPRLAVDLRRQRVVLRLPEQPLSDEPGAEVRWRVDLDGEPHAFRTGRGEGHAETVTEVLDIPVRRPLREIAVADTTHGQSWTIPVVDDEDPVLVFTRRGADLTGRSTLHHSDVEVVCPADATVTDPVRDRDVPVIAERPLKNWDGWVIRHVDLRDALSLHVGRPGDNRPPMSGVRAVDPRQRVRFDEPGEPVPFLESAGGLPIHAASLQAVFPPTVSGDAEIWFLSVSAFAGPGRVGEDVSEEEPLEVPAGGGVFDVLDPEAYDSPWVGEYLVRLRGPRNESFRHEYAVVEGLTLETEVEGPGSGTRIPVVGGLSPVTVRLRPGEKPFEPVPPVVLDRGTQFTTVVVETEAGDALPVVVDPARLRYQLTLLGEDPMWRTEHLETSAAFINCGTRFRVRPGCPIGDPRFVVRDRHGAPVRTLRLTTVDDVTWWVDLAPVAASLPQLTQGSCELEYIDGDRRVSVRLVTLRPRTTWDVELDGDRVRVTPAMPGVDAWVWPVTAPWQSATTVPLTVDGAGAVGRLPATLVDAGDLRVQVFHRDRFNDLRAPVSPGPQARTVTAPGYVDVDDGGPWAQLSAFLAGERTEVPSHPDVLPTLWDVQAGWLTDSAAGLGAGPEAGAAQGAAAGSGAAQGAAQGAATGTGEGTAGSRTTGEATRAALTAAPRASVHAMAKSLVPAEDRPAQFILSGLVHSSFRPRPGEPTQTDVAPAPWIAALEILGQLAATDDYDRAGMRERLRDLTAVAGARLAETVESGRDATLESACIDSTTVQIARMDPAQQEAVLETFFAGSGVVPGALSEDNSRLIAVFGTFRERERLGEVLGDPTLMKIAVSLLRRVKGANRQLYASARVRFDRLDGVDTDDPANRWALAPMVSMIFALATRLYAHGRLSSLGSVTAAYPGWAEMARLVPDLVTGDLVSADAMVTGIFGPDEPAPEPAPEPEPGEGDDDTSPAGPAEAGTVTG